MSNPQTEAETEREEPQLCEGVQLVLQRMSSHPEEFEIDRGKWGSTMRVVYERVMRNTKPNNVIPEPWLTQDEVFAVWSKYKEIKQQEFHEFVMKKLFEEEIPKERMAIKAPGNYVPSSIQPGGIMPLPVGNTSSTTFSESIVSRLKQELGIK